jgi:hypothetical protein
LAGKDANGESITPPGLPASVENVEHLVSTDCIQPASP